MLSKHGARLLGAGVVFAMIAFCVMAARADKDDKKQTIDHKALRAKYTDAHKKGNYKDAYEGLRKLALDPDNDPKLVGGDLTLGMQCLQNLGRVDEIDEFREAVIAKHGKNWRLLETAAMSFRGSNPHGYIVSGQFSRGWKRGGGRLVSTWQRDRVRALQLMNDALPLAEKDEDKAAVASFCLHFAELVQTGAGYHEAWRLQYLTDLSKLPDYEDYYYRWRGSDNRGAPVDENNKAVFYKTPKAWDKAASDGERWRYLLSQAVEYQSALASQVDMHLANFFKGQYGVQTMASHGWRMPSSDDKGDSKTGTFALHTLKKNETIAKLATGLQRFAIEDEFNWITIYERVAARKKDAYGEQAREALAHEYQDRRQYPQAATAWKKLIEEYGKGHQDYRQKQLDQIVGNWGRFEGSQTQPEGAKASVEYRFRNGSKVEFVAQAVKVEKLLEDIKKHIKDRPNTQVDWRTVNIHDVGYRLVFENQSQYVGEKVATWTQELKPRDNHVDSRITVETPMKTPGAYLLTATMDKGNTSRVLIWVADTAIVKKFLDGKVYYFVADAATGKPVERANLDFFGWRSEYVGRNQIKNSTKEFAKTTDEDGQLTLGEGDQSSNHNWLITARKAKDNQSGGDRFAYLGFSGVWYGRAYDPEYNATKTLVITDRPVYRPEHKVKFKAWVRHAKYDQDDVSDFADKTFQVTIHNPKGEKVYEKNLTTDAYAGLNDEYAVPKDAPLGVYSVRVTDNRRTHGYCAFRIEEYKKPEFEVKVEAPKDPVQLGEKIEATIDARYYFGAPVTKGKVKYKVTRNSYSNTWYPVGRWDWFYGVGYWWYAGDYDWFPGFREWGCCKPMRPWWGGWHQDPPEIVMENEVEVGPDGSLKVVIDTMPAKELHGNTDHKYTITAEVTDESRRTIVGVGDVLVSRKPFTVFSWVDRGHYRAGDTVKASFKAQTLDRKPVEGKGELKLYSLSYKDGKPVETTVGTWEVNTNAEGVATHQMKAAKAGQYRLSYKVTDNKKHVIEGGYLFVVRGDNFTGADYRFNDIELVTDKREYAPGEKVSLLINTNQQAGTVLLFVKPTNGIYLAPKVIRLKGKSVAEEIEVLKKDMPNFFIEAVTVHGGKIHSDIREVVVPPEKRVLNVEVIPDSTEYKPGAKAKIKVRLTDLQGNPFEGSTVLTAYDRSVEYISGGTNVPEIRDFFWKWRRHHHPSMETSLSRASGQLLKQNEAGMGNLGLFGAAVVEEMDEFQRGAKNRDNAKDKDGKGDAAPPSAPTGGGGFGGGKGGRGEEKKEAEADRKQNAGNEGGQGPAPDVQPSVRQNFADTAFWSASVKTNKDGIAEVSFVMPEQLTGWKIRVWAMGHGTKVGQGEAEVFTKKDLLIRMQAPRFFVQKDECVLSANVHNYLKTEKTVTVKLELEGGTLESMTSQEVKVLVPPGGEKRVDWRVKVKDEGVATVRMKALTDEESDAMQMSFPCKVHGMLKMESYSGVIRPNKDKASITLTVPKERRVPQTLLEVQYSPTLAGAMVDALPYMVDYPYGCTEQTLNRFLPTVITLRTLQRMKIDLADVQKKRTNLNAQEKGDSKVRAAQWKRHDRNPVFNEAEVLNMAKAGVLHLQSMQCSDGGWGWFSGWGEHSYPHTTAVVVHGLQMARANDIAVGQGIVERGIEWLKNYQAGQIQRLENAPQKTNPYKEHADETDALVYMVLVDNGVSNDKMREFIYRDRTKIGVYAKAMFGLALHKEKQQKKLDMILENVSQYVVEDKENQTAYLKLPQNGWWYWYGSEIEANAYYLKLLSATNPKDEKAAGLVKFLLNNRKHATYWNSTRDTALCIEAMADYLKASGEDKPDMTIEVWLDGKKMKEVQVDAKNLFSFDNRFVIEGADLKDGKHEVELRKKGTGPVYFNAYLTNFTLEDQITKAGLEVKVNRKYYKLERVKDAKEKVRGGRGQSIDQKVEKYERKELSDGDVLKSGDLVEVELTIDSKNDYEYLLFEDMKPAGFEALGVRSGYNGNDMGAYVEFRDDRVCFFVRRLALGKHSVSYRMRAEIPGKFSALPARGEAMYAPELKGNSDEIKLSVTD